MSIQLRELSPQFKETLLLIVKDNFPFDKPYDDQIEVIFDICCTFLSGKKFFFLDAPTGSGKSVIAYTVAKVLNFFSQSVTSLHTTPHIILSTKTKSLQVQYESSFKPFNYKLSSLWSARSYPCNLFPDDSSISYGSIDCTGRKCPLVQSCNYMVAKQEFHSSKIGVLNHAYVLRAEDYSPILNVIDEAHTFPASVISWCQLSFSSDDAEILHDCYKAGHISFNSLHSVIRETTKILKISGASWRVALVSSLINIDRELSDLRITVNKMIDDAQADRLTLRSGDKALLKGASDFFTRIKENLVTSQDESIKLVISEQTRDTLVIKPINLSKLTSKFFDRSKFVLLMSASFCGVESFASYLGIKFSEYSKAEMESKIPVSNRQVYSLGLPGLTRDNRDLIIKSYVDAMDNLIDQFCQGSNGIVHSVSYDLAELLISLSKHSKSMMIPTKEDLLNAKELLAKSSGKILVSPSMVEGLDLDGDLSRFQIWFKMPWPYLGDNWVKAMIDYDKDWYDRETIMSVVQGCGRSIRGPSDHALTFILDGNFNRLLKKPKLFSKWFLESVVSL